MFSRRSFLARTVGGLLFGELLSQGGEASARPKLPSRKKNRKAGNVQVSGPHSIARQLWPPAIVPDHVDIDKRGYLCFADQFGRFSVVDLRKAAAGKEPQVLGELTAVGKRVLAMRVANTWAYALVKEGEGVDTKYFLVAIDLKTPGQPAVVSRTYLDKLDDAYTLIADKDVIFVAGRSKSAENLVLLYAPPGKRGGAEAVFISSIATAMPPVALNYQKRQLIVVENNNGNTRLDIYNLSQLISPQPQNNLELKGTYTNLTRNGDLLVLAGQGEPISGGKYQATSIVLRPAPHAVSTVAIDNFDHIYSAAIQKGQYLLVGKDAGGKLVLNVISVDKLNNLMAGQKIEIPVNKSASVENASLIVSGSQMYVASGWAGVQVLTSKSGQWSSAYSYKIPRLAAAGMATWQDRVVIVGAELMLYSITDPERPQLIHSAPLSSSIRGMVGAGSFVLCLEKDGITLRKMENLERVLALAKIQARSLTFDKTKHMAYAIQPMGKLTRVFPIKVYSDNLQVEKSFDLPGNFTSVQALNGSILLADMNNVALYSTESGFQETGKRKIENLAIRDVCMTDHNILATAINQEQKGFLLVLSKTDKELNLEGSTDLPHNGLAISASNTRAVAIGQDSTGKDLIAIVDISNPTAPGIKANFKVLESASVVAVQSKLALVAGRGLEIVTTN